MLRFGTAQRYEFRVGFGKSHLTAKFPNEVESWRKTNKPVIEVESWCLQRHDSPILDIKWHHTLNCEQPKLIATNNHIVRIWDPETGEGMTSIEPTASKINDICVLNGSGLIVLALDCSEIPAYFIPDLGPAPKWSSSLQNWEELELNDNKEEIVYDNYKFLTKEDLERLGLTNLIGTDLLRAYMHEFFIKDQFYKKAKAIANPFFI